jgi:hypothetical protein
VSRKLVPFKMPLKGEQAVPLQTLYSIERIGLPSLLAGALEPSPSRPGRGILAQQRLWCLGTSEWAATTGEYVGSQKHLMQKLEVRGCITQRKKTARGLVGLRVLQAWEREGDREG